MAIDWKPIGQIPEELKDGRPILVWTEHAEAWVATFDGDTYGGEEPYGWADWDEMGKKLVPLWWAAIDPPGQS